MWNVSLLSVPKQPMISCYWHYSFSNS